MKKQIYYIVAADSGGARIYRSEDTARHLELVNAQSYPAGRKQRSELDSDRAGQQRNDGGGMHGLSGDANTHRQESDRFARLLCGILHDDHVAGRFTDLMIAAPPRFLGELRQHLSADCQKALVRTVDKDLVRVEPQELLAHFV